MADVVLEQDCLQRADALDIFIALIVPTLAGSDIEPDAGPLEAAGLLRQRFEESVVGPVEAGGHGEDAAEGVGVAAGDFEGVEAAEGGAADEGVALVAMGAIGFLDEGFYFLEKEIGVVSAAAAAAIWVGDEGVLAEPIGQAVVDADDDQWRDGFVGDEPGEGFINLPFIAGEAGGAVEAILAVVHVEDGVACIGGGVIAGW